MNMDGAAVERRMAPDGQELCLALDKSGEKRLILIKTVSRDRVRLEIVQKLRGLLAQKPLVDDEAFIFLTRVTQDGEDLQLVLPFVAGLWQGWQEHPKRRITPGEAVELIGRCLQLLTACQQQGLPWFGFHPSDVVWSSQSGLGLIDPRIGLIFEDTEPADPPRALCLPPEVLRGQAWTERSALYTIGLTVYTLLGGVFPYNAGDLSDAAESVLREEPLDIRYLASETSAGLARLLTELLKKDPEKRPSLVRAEEMLGEVARRGSVATSVEQRAFKTKAKRVVQKHKGTRAVRQYWRRRKTIWAAMLVVILLVYLYSRPLSAPILTQQTNPGHVVNLFYQALDESDAVTLNELMAPEADRSMVEMATLAQVFSDFNPLGAREVMRIEELAVVKIKDTPEEAVYTATYLREISSPGEIQKEWCKDRLVLRPVKKLWRIVQHESKILKTELTKLEPTGGNGVDNP